MVRPEGGLYFANVRGVFARLLELVDEVEPTPSVLALDCSASPDWEATALVALEELDESLRERGVELALCSVRPRPLEMLRRSLLARSFEGRLFVTLDEAAQHLQARETGRVSAPEKDSNLAGAIYGTILATSVVASESSSSG